MADDDYDDKIDLIPLMSAEVATALNDSVARHEGGIVTRFVVAVETMDPEGRRGIWNFASEHMNGDDVSEMLHTASRHLDQGLLCHMLMEHLDLG